MTDSGVLILSILNPLMDYNFDQKLKRSGTVGGEPLWRKQIPGALDLRNLK